MKTNPTIQLHPSMCIGIPSDFPVRHQTLIDASARTLTNELHFFPSTSRTNFHHGALLRECRIYQYENTNEPMTISIIHADNVLAPSYPKRLQIYEPPLMTYQEREQLSNAMQILDGLIAATIHLSYSLNVFEIGHTMLGCIPIEFDGAFHSITVPINDHQECTLTWPDAIHQLASAPIKSVIENLFPSRTIDPQIVIYDTTNGVRTVYEAGTLRNAFIQNDDRPHLRLGVEKTDTTTNVCMIPIDKITHQHRTIGALRTFFHNASTVLNEIHKLYAILRPYQGHTMAN